MKNTAVNNETGKPYFPLFGFIMSALLPALGIALFFFPSHGYQSYKAHSQADDWPATTGVVTRSQVIKEKGNRNSHDIQSKKDMYRADIHIQYEVNGRTYSINELYVGQSQTWGSDNARAQALSNKYPVGKAVLVSYSPEQPSLAVVETDVKIISIILFVLMAIFIFAGVWLLYLSLRDLYRFIKHYIVKWIN